MHQIGEVLQGRYRIEALLGQGGMGGVYLATHVGLRTRVAIKQMTLDADEPGLVAQFRREAQMLHELQHQNLPRVHDFFSDGGQHYLVMDYIEGETLDDRIRFAAADEADVLRWAAALCKVLDYLHNHQPPIIFRDLKPSNIMLGKDGIIRLIDFGIAKEFDTSTGGGTRTAVRGAGTPGFAAPEQYGTGTDARTDIYALGATLYCLLTRVVPPVATDRAGGTPMRPLNELRADLQPQTVAVIHQMLALNRKDRPDTMREVASRLGLAWATPTGGKARPAVTASSASPGGGETVLSPLARAQATAPVPAPQGAATARRRSPVGMAAAAAAIVTALAGAGWYLTHSAPAADHHDIAHVNASSSPPQVPVSSSPSQVAANLTEKPAPPSQTPSASPSATPQSQSPPPDPDDDAIIPGNRIGKVRLGADAGSLITELGLTHVTFDPHLGEDWKRPGMEVYVWQGRVNAIRIFMRKEERPGRDYRTQTGLTLGVPGEQVLKAQGNAEQKPEDNHVNYVYRNPPIAFNVGRAGKVYGIRIGPVTRLEPQAP